MSLKEKTANGLLWGGISSGIQQLLNAAFGIVLARILTPDDYGMVGMLLIFSQISTALTEGGFLSALNKRETVTDNDFNSVFWCSSLCGIAFYLILFFCAPLIADFYNEPKLIPLSRYMFLSIMLSAFAVAPRAVLFRKVMVKETAIITITSLLFSGSIAIIMAMNGFAYWGIATQTIVFILVVLIMNLYYSKWHPTLKIDFRPVKEMLVFSSKLIFTNIVNIVNNNVFNVILGHFNTKTDVGNFSEANKWNTMGHSFITGTLVGIAQPILAKINDDKQRQINAFRKLLRFTAFLAFPAMFGLSLVAKEFVVICVTEKWIASAAILQILCIWGAFVPLCNLCTHLLISRGKSGVYMRSTIGICIVGLLTILCTSSFSLQAMILAFVCVNILWLFVWLWLIKRETGLSILSAIKDILPYALLSIVLVVGTYFVTRGIENIYIRFASKILIVAIGYYTVLRLVGSVILRESIDFLVHKKISE